MDRIREPKEETKGCEEMKHLRVNMLNGESWTFVDNQAEEAYQYLEYAANKMWKRAYLNWGKDLIVLFTAHIVSIRKTGEWE